MDSIATSEAIDEKLIFPPQSRDEYEHLTKLVASLSEYHTMTRDEQNYLIQELESYECYFQVDQLIRWRLAHADASHLELMQDYIWLLKVHYLGLESFTTFVEIAQNFIRELNLPFSSIRQFLLEEILGPENFREQARVLRAVADDVQDVSQKILLLERLALILEKKLFIENEFEALYHRILDIDPNNEKARKFFKLNHMHNMEWPEAAEQLKVLMAHTKNDQERIRYSHELAQLYVYNLNQPGAALEILRPLAGRHPEMRYSLIEALERLDLVDEVLATLQKFESASIDDDEKSQFKFRRGNILLKLGQTSEAIAAFRESLQIQPESLLAHESLISALVDLKRVDEIELELLKLREIAKFDSSRSILNELIERVGHFNHLQGWSNS